PQQLPAHLAALRRNAVAARPRRWTPLGCLVLAPSLALGAWVGTAARAGDPPAEPVFTLHAADGTTATGPLRKIADDWSVRLGGGRPALVAGPDVITLRRDGTPLPPAPVAEQVVLSNGDRVPLAPGTPLRMTGERLDCTPRPPLGLTA